MANPPLFNVVIPLYNKEKYIQRSINSVLNQSITDFKLIVVNDGSTDSSEQLAAQCDDPRVNIINQKNAGVSVARNTGILNSDAKYVALLDADDEWMPNFLEKIYSLITAFPQAQVYATAILIKTNSREYPTRMMGIFDYHSEGLIQNLFACLVRNQYMLSSSSICIQRDLSIKVGLFDKNLSSGEDIDMWMRLFLFSKIAFSTSVHALYYKMHETKMSDYPPESVEKEIKKLTSLEFSKMVPSQFQKDYYKFIQIKISRIIRHYAELGRKKDIMKIYQQYSTKMHLKTKLSLFLLYIMPHIFIKQIKQVYKSFMKYKKNNL